MTTIMNVAVIKEFQSLIDYHKSEGTNNFKIRAFQKALSAIKNLEFEIESVDDVKNIPGIGKGTSARIGEILNTGKLAEIKNKSVTNELKELMRITGIGPAKASVLYTNGITLEILKTNPEIANDNLTHHQLIGLKYLTDIESRIPYSEITEIQKYIGGIFKTIDVNLQFDICGSYRRKQPDSGDIDILIYYKSRTRPNDRTDLLKQIVSNLTLSKFLVEHLTECGNTKYMGMCRLNNALPARRIDIRYINPENVPFAILYFTGSGEFNKNMRIYAQKLGYKLNEYCLEKIEVGHQPNGYEPKKIYLKNEKEIFQFLKLKYVNPSDRVSDYCFSK